MVWLLRWSPILIEAGAGSKGLAPSVNTDGQVNGRAGEWMLHGALVVLCL
jgi:hypothetical protein